MTFLARSIRLRLLLLIAGVALGLVIVHDVAALVAMRRAAALLAHERLTRVDTRLGDMLAGQGTEIKRMLAEVAADPGVRSLIAVPADARRTGVAATSLQRFITGTSTGMELWDSVGRPLVTVGVTPAFDSAYARSLRAAMAGRDSAAIGPMRQVGDSLLYATVARVHDAGRLRGYVVQWRRTVVGPAVRSQLVSLIDTDAEVLVGGRDAGVWTDFATVVSRPPVTAADTGIIAYERSSRRYVASAQVIPGTPWMLVVAIPERVALAPVRAMRDQLILVTLALLPIAIVAAWLFGARLTRPITDLAAAATAIARGDYTRRVAATGPDELGALGRAFNDMAASVGAANESLREHSEELADRAEQLAQQATELEAANEELTQSIDEATRARDDLAAVSAELDACLGSAPIGFGLHDSAGRYRRVNAGLARLHGVPVDAHAGRLPSEVIPGLGRQIEQHVRASLASGEPVLNVELSGETPAPAGREQYWLASVFPIRTGTGKHLGVGSVVTDLTAYKRLETRFLHAQKMEAVGRLAGGVAHDFNNILTAISGFAQLALADLDDRTTSGVRSDIEQVLDAADRASALTRQLLTFSRQQVLQPRVLSLNAVVAGLSPMLSRLIGSDIRLQTKEARDLAMVWADPNLMDQVLVNLVVNARDAMPNGGTLLIETANVELDEEYTAVHVDISPGAYVMLAVTDSGIGMDAATQARIFEPFFTTKGKGHGTGLGLSTVYGIVRQSGGTVNVYSEPGVGTTFKIYLPKSAGRVADVAPSRGASWAQSGGATVLLVDDDAYVAAAVRRTLERAGYTVLAAASGADALRAAEAHAGTIDLLIADLVMPEMGGRALAQRLAAARPTMRVLFTSGFSADAASRQAILEPDDAFLGKPFTRDALLQRVNELLHPA